MKKINSSVLTYEQKEKIWSTENLSGSKFKRWVLNPETFNDNDVDLSFIEEKLEWGNLLEDTILKEVVKNFDLKLTDNFKNTFNKDNTFYANIDGMADNEYGERFIIEIKNSEITDFDRLKETYKYQMAYYSYFFKIKKVIFAVLINGCKLRTEIIDFSDEWEFVERQLTDFNIYLETGSIPKNKLIWKRFFKEEIKTTDHDEILNWYGENQDKIKLAEKIKKEVVENTINPSEKFNIGKWFVSVSTTKESRTINYKVIVDEIIKEFHISDDLVEELFNEYSSVKKGFKRASWKWEK